MNATPPSTSRPKKDAPRRRLVAFLVATALLAGAAACTTSPPKTPATEEENQDSIVTIDSFRTRLFEGATSTTVVTAAKGLLNATTGKARLEDVQMFFTSETLQVECTGETANLYMKDFPLEGFWRNDIELEGDVRLTKHEENDPVRIWTSNLRYNAGEDDQTYVGQGVAFDLEMIAGAIPIRLQGRQFSASRNLNDFHFEGPGEFAYEDAAATTSTLYEPKGVLK